MISIQECPLFEPSQAVVTKAKELAVVMHRLRKARRTCLRCQQSEGCPILRDIDTQLSLAIQEIQEEWGLQ